MSDWVSRPFGGRADVGAMVELARAEMLARAPKPGMLHPGDVTWQCWNRRDLENVRLWEQDGHLRGYVDFEPPLNMVMQLHPDVDPAGVSTLAMDDDPTRIAALESHGYARVDRFSFRFRRSLEHIPEPKLPDGMRLRHVTEADIEERIDLHRDAWSVWGPSAATVEAYGELRAAPWYEPELDVVLEHEGRLVSYAIGWVDEASGVGVFEPVGTRPAYAGRGLARLVLYEGLRRMKGRGMTVARIGTASVNVQAERCYLGAGFEHEAREWYWSKPIFD